MLHDLPIEVLEQVIGHLPTASAVTNLSQTNRALHSIISADDYNVFRTFVQKAFPAINSPPLWKDVGRTLTSRSRAWDRRAFITRECYPPTNEVDLPHNGVTFHTVGYHPMIDSYESWQGGSWSSRKEVLAWGAGGRLRIRTINDGVTTWNSYKTPEDHRQQMDILDVRILRPHQRETSDGEAIVLRRADGEVIKVENSGADGFTQTARFCGRPEDFSCMDISADAEPILAAFGNSGINLYSVRTSEKFVKPTASTKLEAKPGLQSRMRSAKFLASNSVALATQFLKGWDRAPISIFDVSSTGLSPSPLIELARSSGTSHPVIGRHSPNVIEPLYDISASGTRSATLILSGWTDGVARLYDTRIPSRSAAEYADTVDEGLILSLLTMGHDRFLAGSSQNGCLRTFDLRMPGRKVYSYLDARPSESVQRLARSKPQKDFNIFLTPEVNYNERLWEPLPRHPGKRSQRYRGSVYSLSSPSPTSPTVYAGIANHVLQLDFVCTDDLRDHKIYREFNLSDRKSHDPQHRILDLSCYERPRKGKESTDPVLLRKQADLYTALNRGPAGASRGLGDRGWDERLFLNFSDSRSPESDWRGRRRPPT